MPVTPLSLANFNSSPLPLPFIRRPSELDHILPFCRVASPSSITRCSPAHYCLCRSDWLVLQRDPQIPSDDVLAGPITLDERIQPQFRVRHQRIANNNPDESLWLHVDVELLRVVRSRSVEQPKPHQTSADRKTRHESSIRLTPKHFACISGQLYQCFGERSSSGFCLCSPITSTFDQSCSPSGKAASAGVRKMSSLRSASDPLNTLLADV
jgi:hypothetical protein